MLRPFHSYFITMILVWAALAVATRIYAPLHEPATWIIAALFPAFLLESTLYLFSCFRATRNLFALLPGRASKSSLLFASALLPYLVLAAGSHTFDSRRFALLALLSAAASFWPVLLPHRPPLDLGYLLLLAAPLITRTFRYLYVTPDPHVQADLLGHLMWIRVAILAWLVLRRWDVGKFGLWPRSTEWRKGFRWFAVVVIPLFALGVGIRFVRFQPVPATGAQLALLALGTFFGVLWVVALGEELFFRGVIQRGLTQWAHNSALAVVAASLIYGAAHLWYRQFPNWRFALLATVAGIAYGRAYQQTGGVRAPMVTHALVVTTWRLFFR